MLRDAPEAPEVFERFMRQAIQKILSCQDAQTFLSWAAGQQLPSPVREDADPKILRSLAVVMGRALWNATPLPRNGYLPEPLPDLGRNAPCPCGSGAKFKRCCGGVPLPAHLEPEAVWLIAWDAMKGSQRKEALASGNIPPEVVMGLAHGHMEEGAPKKALALLEPLFEGDLRRRSDRWAPAVEMVAEAHASLGHRRKESDFLERIAREGHGRIRAAACQRMAILSAGFGEQEEAWRWLGEAASLAPEDPDVALTEITLLFQDGQFEKASARAAFWRKKLARSEESSGRLLDFLSQTVRDPEGTFLSMKDGPAGFMVQRLLRWAKKLEGRALPRYRVEAPVPLDVESPEGIAALAEKYRAMGYSEAEAEGEAERASRRIRAQRAEAEEREHRDGREEFSEFGLACPDRLDEVEELWEEVRPWGKPVLTSDIPSDDDLIWDPDEEDDWIEFIETHPDAFDSMEILDDLSSAARVAEEDSIPGGAELSQILLKRGTSIAEAALSGMPPGATLPWSLLENRPALRLLVRRAGATELQEGWEAAFPLYERVLALNPNDNHGLRQRIVNESLRRGSDAQALALADRYPDDAMAETTLGRALALFRLGRREEASEALKKAATDLPIVLKMLLGKDPKPAPMRGFTFRWGSREQAWAYYEEMGEVWAETPGARDWLLEQASAFSKKPPRKKPREEPVLPMGP